MALRIYDTLTREKREFVPVTPGHVGMYVETAHGSVLCDPWFTPAYFGSWFPFPDNSGLDWDALGDCDYLYVSHLHRDHFDPKNLRDHVNKDAVVLLPDTIGPEALVLIPGVIPGLNVACHALTAPGDGLLMQLPVYPPILRSPTNHGLSRDGAPLGRERDGRYVADLDAGRRLYVPAEPVSDPVSGIADDVSRQAPGHSAALARHNQ